MNYIFGKSQRKSSSNGGQKVESSIYANADAQKQELVKTRVFLEQLDGIFKHLGNILKMVEDREKYGDRKIDLVNDLLIDSLNYFGQNCYSYRKQGYFDALELAQKKVYDKWEKLDSNTFNMTQNYRRFLMNALKSKKLIQYEQQRILSEEEEDMTNKAMKDPKTMNNAMSKLIYNKAKIDQRFDKYKQNPMAHKDKNDEELNEYRKNKKYHNNNISAKPQINGMYFTERGKTSKFVFDDNINNEMEEKLNNHLMGDNNSDIDMEDEDFMPSRYKNAVIKCSQQNQLGPISQPIPCYILEDDVKKPKDGRNLHVLLPAPYYKKEGFKIDIKKYDIIKDEQYVEKIENQYMKFKQIQSLGAKYPSIVEQQQNALNDLMPNV